MKEQEIGALARLILAVAKQRRFMQPWIGDKRFAANGGTLLHAVDTDVISFYTAPEKNAVASGAREGYAQIFPEDDTSLAEALGRALVTQLFYHIERQHPLLVLPPMEKEVGAVFAGMTLGADREQKVATKELGQLRRQAAAWKDEGDAQVLLDRLRREAPTMFAVLRGTDGASRQIVRLRRLLRDVRIAPLDYALENGDVSDPSLRAALAPATDFADRVRFSDLKEGWFVRLVQTKSESRSRVLIFDDAQVLARVQWVNERLDPDRFRLVLITGDSAIHEAARSYRPEQAEHCFADLYLRHPRAYLGEPGVLDSDGVERGGEEEQRPGSKLLELLDILLAKVDVRGAGYRADLDEYLAMSELELRERCASVLKTHPNILTEFRDRWGKYTENLKVSYALTCVAEDLSVGLKDLQHDVQAVMDRIEDELRARIRQTWDAYFEVVTDLGYGLLFQQAIQCGVRARNPPVLSYDTFDQAGTFLKRMLSSRAAGKWDKSYRYDLEALRQEDPSRYTYFLAFAVLYAAEGVWHIAALLAEKAMDLADAGTYERISGREAAYMRAVALRHAARRVADLDQVGPMINVATQRLERDRLGRPDIKAGEIRFAAEWPALWLTYHLFDLFAGANLPEWLPPLPQVQVELESVLRDLDAEIRQTDGEKKSGRLLWIYRNVERNLLINLFMVALLRCAKVGEVLDRDSYRHPFARLRANIEADDDLAIERSFLVSAVYTAAAWWMSNESTERRRLRKEMETLLTDQAVKENSVLPYGERRFRFLRDLVCAQVPRSPEPRR